MKDDKEEYKIKDEDIRKMIIFSKEIILKDIKEEKIKVNKNGNTTY